MAANAFWGEGVAHGHAAVPVSELTVSVPATLFDQIAAIAAERAIAQVFLAKTSPYMTVKEAAEYLRCDRQRVYDLLSQQKLTRFKDGSRVLISRTEIDAYLAGTGSTRVAQLLPMTPQSRMVEPPHRRAGN